MACISSFSSSPPNILRNSQRGNIGTISCRKLKIPHAATFSRLEMDENPEGIISGEWPECFSLLSFDDLSAYFLSQETVESNHDQADHGPVRIGQVMSRPVRAVRPDQTLHEVSYQFESVSLLPVVDQNLRCVGVISKKDMTKGSYGLGTKIAEMMTSPAITLTEDKTVTDAAALMLKTKVHRIPVVNKDRQVIGIITRTDVLRGLEDLLQM
ncbi:hypothetical protein LUZ60_006882 [Juncus effusus]|nr:hypothetical protein LUZ60_006882 [Juncus effusus]